MQADSLECFAGAIRPPPVHCWIRIAGATRSSSLSSPLGGFNTPVARFCEPGAGDPSDLMPPNLASSF